MGKKGTGRMGRRIALLVPSAALCLAFCAWQAGRVQVQAQGLEIVLTPSAPVRDNEVAGVYGCYNGDGPVSVEVQVKTQEDGPGIRQISYRIMDGTEGAETAGEERILYEDLYVEEPREPEEPEDPEEPGEPEDSEDPEEPGESEESEDSETPEKFGDPEESEEPGETDGEEEEGKSGDPEDGKDPEDHGEPEPDEEGEMPEDPENPKEGDGSGEPGASEEPEVPEDPGEEEPEHEALSFWTGNVLVYPERWHTGEVRVRVKVIDFAGEEQEASVQLDIDIDAPELRITGVEDGNSYRDAVTPAVEISDRNFSDFALSLSRTRLDETDADVTDRFSEKQELGGEGGTVLLSSPERTRENDGIYTLTVSATDRAGNESRDTVTFSVNRFGSVYVFDDYLLSLLRDGGIYTREITEDLVITEYNADRLLADSLLIDITRDGRPVTDVQCRTSPDLTDTATVGRSGWYEYRYVISRDNFTRDGIYKVSVSSRDAAGNTPDNAEATGREILFRVDSTAPEITGVTKTDAGGTLAEGENFSYTVYDTVGLSSLELILADGEETEEITDFGTNANYYEGTLSLEQSLEEREIRLVATDFAGNVAEESYTIPAVTRGILRRQSGSGSSPRLEQRTEERRLFPCLLGIVGGTAVLAFCFTVRGIRQRN